MKLKDIGINNFLLVNGKKVDENSKFLYYDSCYEIARNIIQDLSGSGEINRADINYEVDKVCLDLKYMILDQIENVSGDKGIIIYNNINKNK